MARSPSLLALLGLVAVAGYQNRGRISEMLTDAKQRSATGVQPESSGGFLSEIGGLFQGGAAGGGIATALGDLVERFKGSGNGAAADNWVSTETNRPVNSAELEAALGQDTLVELGQKTGLSRSELLQRLNVALPEVVNRFTPNGRLPTQDEAQSLI